MQLAFRHIVLNSNDALDSYVVLRGRTYSLVFKLQIKELMNG